MHHGFGFYHHSPSEIIQHAYDKRFDCEYLIGEMGESASGGLNLAEYPSPVPGQTVYMVKENGNHRSLLFRLLNLPCVMSIVERNVTACWLYAHSDGGVIGCKQFSYSGDAVWRLIMGCRRMLGAWDRAAIMAGW